jgi:hypothetical protein
VEDAQLDVANSRHANNFTRSCPISPNKTIILKPRIIPITEEEARIA